MDQQLHPFFINWERECVWQDRDRDRHTEREPLYESQLQSKARILSLTIYIQSKFSQKRKWVSLMHACRLAIHTSSKRGVGQGDKMASGHEDDSGSGQEQTKKPSASTFHPTLWGDFFLSHEPPTSLQVYFCLRWAVVPALVNLLLWDRNGRLEGGGNW